MNKDEYQKELDLDRKQFPYEPKDEKEALEIAQIALEYNIEEPDEALSSNFLIQQYLKKQYGAKIEADEQEKEIQKSLKEKETLKKAVGLEDEKNINRLKSSIQSEEYAEALRVKLGLKSEYDKDSVREQVRKRASEIKKVEIAEKESEKRWQQKFGHITLKEVSEEKERIIIDEALKELKNLPKE